LFSLGGDFDDGYDHDEAWGWKIEREREFGDITDISKQGQARTCSIRSESRIEVLDRGKKVKQNELA
jgi:hypothetical protein